MTVLNIAKVREAIKNSKGILTVVAQKCGVTRNAVYVYIENHPELKPDLQNERESMTDFTEGKFFQAINNNENWAISLYLKTLGKNRGYVERQEIVSNVNNDDLKRLQGIVTEVEQERKKKVNIDGSTENDKDTKV